MAEPPGTTEPGAATAKGGGLEIFAGAGPGGVLFFNSLPALGEPSISGRIQVAPVGTNGGPAPADTVLTLNGVQLVREGVTTATYFVVDPAGPQPTISSDGFLHLSASSASTGASRALNLACPFAIAARLTPASGASLAGASVVSLAWPSGSLPVQVGSFGVLQPDSPQVSLHGFDPATRALSPVLMPGTGIEDRQLLVPDSVGATLPVVATSAPGYVVELRYPGIFFLDGETGGACGRTQRFVYLK